VLRRHEDKQQASEQLSTLASTAPGAMYAFRLRADGTSCFPYASPQIRELFCLDPKELAVDSKPAWERIHPEDLGYLQATIAEAARRFSPWRETFRVRHPVKGWIWIEGSSMPTKEPNGDILWHGFLIDITERKMAEETMRLERERLRRMVDTAQVGIAFMSPDGEVHEANDALLRMIGWTREEFATGGLNWRTLSPPEYWELDREATKEMLRRGSADPAERMLLRKDGSRIPVLCNGVTLPGEQGEEIAIFVLDLTAMRRLEGALQEAGETSQGRIARDLHDGLGQQLGGVLYLGRLLQKDLQARGAPEAGRAAEVNRLVKEALEVTRNVARGLHPVPNQPDGLMLALQALIERTTATAKIKLVFQCQVAVLIEDNRTATQLYRIVQEAINNSLKHSRGKRVEVRLWEESGTILLRVRDNGIGLVIGPAGRGLGMQSMNHRATLIGAFLTIENAPDGGTVVTIRVPRVPGGGSLQPQSPGRDEPGDDGGTDGGLAKLKVTEKRKQIR
jgi:PAS domain S-box-containing protein